jgi:putative hydrolase of the HAD superfamily
MTSRGVDALLFDVGGVVVRIDFGQVFTRWAAHAVCDPARLRQRFSQDAPYQRHERGEIAVADYFASLRTSLGINLDDARLLDGWNTIFIEEMPGISALLARLGPRIPIYAFANTNHAHAAHLLTQFAPVLGHFRKVFTSCTIGLRKPEPAAFDYVVREIGVPAGRVLFFDDTLANVDGARACGLQAVHVTSDKDVANVVSEMGL